MDISNYLAPLRKWWWLLVAATLLAAVSSFLAARQQPPGYEARTTLMVGRAVYDPNPNSNELYLSQQLAAAYADMAQRDPVKDATMAALGVTWLPEYVARQLPNTQLIEIAVTDTVPERAQSVANELANQVMRLGPSSHQQEGEDRQEFVKEQLDYLETKIEETQTEISDRQSDLADMSSAGQIADTQQTIAGLQTKLTSLQANYATLLATTQRGAVNILSVIEPAVVPAQPVGPNVSMIVALASAIGLILAAMGAYLLEYLDDTLRTQEDVAQVLRLPVLTSIPETKKGMSESAQVLVGEDHDPVMTEAFRSLRGNLDVARQGGKVGTLLVTSPGPEEGKTTVAVNLAASVAQGGRKVVLLDADLRRPKIHEYVGFTDIAGIGDVIQGMATLEKVKRPWGHRNLAVVAGGKPTPSPADALSSQAVVDILRELERSADVVIIDGPPFLVADAWLLAGRVDWVLVVVDSGRTRRGQASMMMEQLRRSGAKVMGVALNRTPRGSSPYHAYTSYRVRSSGKPLGRVGPAASSKVGGAGQKRQIREEFMEKSRGGQRR